MRDMERAWHRDAISAGVEQTLNNLWQTSALQRFYLAGGTGLALQIGHRRSLDLDFFTGDPFSQEELLERLILKSSEFELVAKDFETLHAHIAGIKVSFLGYAYPVLFPFAQFGGIEVADSRDIACMKVSAIAGRGAKRDFIDLHASSTQHGLPRILDWFREKYARANYSRVHILKSLTYFDEAEQDPMPDMLIKLTWTEVKAFFLKEVPRLL
jgi:hypothetical protein